MSASTSALAPRTAAPTLLFAALQALARASHAVLLAFLDARIGREQPVLLQLLPQLRVVLDERARDRQPHRAGLSVLAAAGDRREDVELLARLRQEQRPPDLRPQRVGREVFVELSVVDGDGALDGAEENACGGCLATARCVIFDACQLCDLDVLWLLGD